MDVKDIIKKENFVYGKSKVLTDNPMHYCPGCTHGVVHKVLAEVIEELGIQDKTIGVSPVGCAVLAYNYLDIDWHEAAHGRAPAVASAIKDVQQADANEPYYTLYGTKAKPSRRGLYIRKGKKFIK